MDSDLGAAPDSRPQPSSRGDTTKTVITVASAIIAALSCYFAWQSFRSNQIVASVNVYMQLRQEFNTLREQIPHEYFIDKNHAVPPGRSDAWGKISKYWYLSFDEWYITTHLGDPVLKQLWRERYQYLIAPQLENRAFREVLCSLVREKLTTPLQREFVAELRKEFRDRTASTTDLCPDAKEGQGRSGSDGAR